LTVVALGRECRAANNDVSIGFRANKNNTSGTNVVLGSFANSSASTSAGSVVIGYNTGLGISTGDYNTVVGASFTFPSNVSNNVVLSDGQGNAKLWDDDITVKVFNPLQFAEMTTAQRTGLANTANTTVYDTDLNKLFTNDGTSWNALW